MQDHIRSFLAPRVAPGDRLLVAFSGGPDSTALLAATAEIADRLRIGVAAAHLDHALDPQSPERAARAVALAERLGVRIVVERRAVASLRRPGESLEEAARRVRYAFLAERLAADGGRWILTAHHRDDQAETVVLRLRQGGGIAGLAGIRAEVGRVLRPALDLPRSLLAAECRRRGLETNDDPSNRDPRGARAFVRHRLLPALADDGETGQAELAARLAAVAAAAARAQPAVDRHLAVALSPAVRPAGVTVERARLAALPAAVRPAALGYLARLAGAPHPPSARAQAELWRRLGAGHRIGCDSGEGWRWTGDDATVTLRRAAGRMPAFTYTFTVPGHCDVPEIGRRVLLYRAPVADWMRVGEPRRAALAASIPAGGVVEVRNRRPGDRVHPLGAPGERKLKEVLVDRRVPRAERDHLPLLCIDGRIAWVPGVTIDERFRVRAEEAVWVAQVEEL